jgi:chromosome segregation ATPase
MSDIDEKVLKMLEELQADVKGMKADVAGVKSDVSTLKTDVTVLRAGQKTLEAGQNALEAGQKTLASGQQALELKVEAIHAYQKQAHGEIMEHLIESNEVNGQAQQHLEKELERIKKHVGLPPVK